MAKTIVPEEILEKLERHAPFARLVHSVREASEERSVVAAEVQLGTMFLLSPGVGHKIGLRPHEEDSVGMLVRGEGFPNPPGEKKP